MPWHVAKTAKCPSSKPFGVINNDTSDVNGRCHATKDGAVKQMQAMYANTEPGDRSEEDGGVATWEWEGGAMSMPVYDE